MRTGTAGGDRLNLELNANIQWAKSDSFIDRGACQAIFIYSLPMDIQPRTQAQKILDRILHPDLHTADDPAIACCRKIAGESLPVDPVSSPPYPGTHFMEAYNCTHHVDVFFKHFPALRNAKKMADAATVAEYASNASPADLELLRTALSMTMAAGRFEKALSLANAYKLRAPYQADFLGAALTDAIAALKANKVPLTEVIQAHDIAYSLLHELNVPSVGHCLETEQSPDQTVSSIILLDADMDRVLALGSLLADRLFDEMDELHLADFWIGFEPKEQGNTDGN